MKKNLLLAIAAFAFVGAQAQTVLWQENFNGQTTLPAGWSQTTQASDGGWRVNTAANLSSQYFTIPTLDGNILGTNDDQCNCNKSNDFIKLPEFDLTGVATPYLLFDRFYVAGTYQGNSETLKVEVSTDGGTTFSVITTLAGASGWTASAIDLTPYSGQTIQVGFRYNDGSGWLFGVGLDNMRLIEPDLSIVDAVASNAQVGVFVPDVPRVYGGYTKCIVGEQVRPILRVSNNAFTAITSFDATYIHNGGTPVTQSFTGLNLGYGQSTTISFDTPATAVSGNNSVSFSISNVNGGAETVTNNNGGGSATITGVTPLPNRWVVAEEGTGTWCGWCPRGAVFMDYMSAKYPNNFIGIAVHNGDPMTVSAYDTPMGAAISGYPSGLVDRAAFSGSNEVDPQDFERAFLERVTVDNGVNVSNAISFVGNTAYITSNLAFTQAVNGNYRIAVAVIEDGVTGTGSTWNQTNYYAGGGNGPMGGYEALGSSVPASSMVYEHVARALLGGWSGFSGSVPTSNPAGSNVSYTTTYTVPSTQNMAKLKAVTMLIRQTGGQIVNAGISQPFSVGIEEEAKASFGVNVFPNPAADQTNINITTEKASDVHVRIMDAAGRVVADKMYKNMIGDNYIPVETSYFQAGYYVVSVRVNDEMIQKSLLIAR